MFAIEKLQEQNKEERNMQENSFPTYVFATVNAGRVQNVVEELKRNSQIDFIAPVTGRFDLVLRLKPTAPEQIHQTINTIRQVHDIRTTATQTAFNGYQQGKMLENHMALGFSLLNIHDHSIEDTLKQVSSIPGLVEAYEVPGQYDIIALWQAKTAEEIMKTSAEKLSHVGGLFRSETLLAYAPFFKS
jgi:DNA-binding Lrp family transcriptional regulator